MTFPNKHFFFLLVLDLRTLSSLDLEIRGARATRRLNTELSHDGGIHTGISTVH